MHQVRPTSKLSHQQDHAQQPNKTAAQQDSSPARRQPSDTATQSLDGSTVPGEIPCFQTQRLHRRNRLEDILWQKSDREPLMPSPEHVKPEHVKPEHVKPEHVKPEQARQTVTGTSNPSNYFGQYRWNETRPALEKKGGRGDSNPRHPEPQSGALTN